MDMPSVDMDKVAPLSSMPIVDMDKVAPLSSSAPHTGRSGSSSATPRTGGGLTARSSDGKGTPREVERLPLGARPPPRSGSAGASGSGGPPALVEALLHSSPRHSGGALGNSPLQTARSGAVSTPSSSQGQWSSRTHGEPFAQDGGAPPFPLGAHGAASVLAGADAQSRQQCQRPGWLTDISREIEVMRHVIVKENERLQEEYRATRDALDCLRAKTVGPSLLLSPTNPQTTPVGSTASPPDAAGMHRRVLEAYATTPSASSTACAARPLRPRRSVEWRIRSVDAAQAAALGQRAKSGFQLPEYPGVTFAFNFGIANPSSAQSTDAPNTGNAGPGHNTDGGAVSASASITASPQWRLSLTITGPSSADLCLQVGLEVELDVPAASAGGASSPGMLGRRMGEVLRGGGRTSCKCLLPEAKIPGAIVVCRAHIELVGWLSLEPSKCAPADDATGGIYFAQPSVRQSGATPVPLRLVTECGGCSSAAEK